MIALYQMVVVACTLTGMTFLLASGEWGFALLLFMAGTGFSVTSSSARKDKS
ncbi:MULTISPECIES: hypothetical protein [Hyphobacterium]|uniref:Uncharacterized protein n=1 Tax=Hyphobacterium vulgare TaxID=1736751 RepID=A0ABV6ZUA7_9PROT